MKVAPFPPVRLSRSPRYCGRLRFPPRLRGCVSGFSYLRRRGMRSHGRLLAIRWVWRVPLFCKGSHPSETRADVRLGATGKPGSGCCLTPLTPASGLTARKRSWHSRSLRRGNRLPPAGLETAETALRIPGTTKADVVVPVRWLVPVTVRDADVLWIVVTRAPAHFGRVPLPLG